ncbi:hypothetical protein HDU98_007733 [Podochytrium sp. JEL0797]|nr:hypothetical protein HDU98_007733 [Podochytrium sp. JEL0797]
MHSTLEHAAKQATTGIDKSVGKEDSMQQGLQRKQENQGGLTLPSFAESFNNLAQGQAIERSSTPRFMLSVKHGESLDFISFK